MAKRAGILALHPTSPLGKHRVTKEGGVPNRAYAYELAKRGCVVIAPDYPPYGDYKYDFESDDYVSGTMKGIFNHMRCVDLLQSLPEVDPKRIGAIGHSLGGHNAMFVGVFDTRIRVIVSSCGWTPFHDYYGGKITGWTSDRYMPLLKTRYGLNPDRVPFDFYEVVAALAPIASRWGEYRGLVWVEDFVFCALCSKIPKFLNVLCVREEYSESPETDFLPVLPEFSLSCCFP